jgi:asparagine synthase (glutamine-hydrolysing)
MCGIGALFDPRGALAAEWLRSMQAAVRHRGPDDEGVACFGPAAAPRAYGGPDTPESVYDCGLPYAPARGDVATQGARLALVHRRLSILDLSPAGHQPMCTSEGDYWIVFVGEIYNYLELREELAALGETFASRSDTEIILAAYRAWGQGCVSRFNGMFAFVLYDRPGNRLFAARDRFGVKPLYYWVAPGGLVALGSEIKQFTKLPGWRPRVNAQRAYDFLNWALQDHTDETLYDGVFQLRGGEALVLDLNEPAARPGPRLPVYRWYEMQPSAFQGTLADAGMEFRRLLTDSVRLRMRADVPIGSCLSGGLDSSSIVCLMNVLLGEHGARTLQNTFSACATIEQFDERPYIEEVVRHTGVCAHYVYPRLDELFGINDRITWHHDEPFKSTSIYAQWRVFELAAREGVTVMLDGQGADEHLAGYHSFFAARFQGLLRGLRWLALRDEVAAARRLHGYGAAWGLNQALGGLVSRSVRQPLRRLLGRTGASAPWLDMERLGAAPRDPYGDPGAGWGGSMQEMSRAQLLATSLPALLHYEDRDSMAHSIEAREPFLDYRLVEFVLGLPDDHKIAAGMTKRVLREGLRGTLPEPVRNRVDKLGFATPEEAWLRKENPALFRAALREAIDVSGGILRPEMGSLLERMIAGGEPFSFLIWRCISFGAWLRTCEVGI